MMAEVEKKVLIPQRKVNRHGRVGLRRSFPTRAQVVARMEHLRRRREAGKFWNQDRRSLDKASRNWRLYDKTGRRIA